MTTPIVSICIPTYNQERFITEALRSVCAQTYPHYEVLVRDDASSDATAAIAQQFAAVDTRIRVEVNSTNLGMVANWNRCLAEAQGTYIKFLFGDDFFAVPDALEQMVTAMETASDIALVASGRSIVTDQSKCTEVISSFPEGFTADGKELIRRCLRKIVRTHNLIGEPSVVMFKRRDAARGFDPRYRQLVDIEMWFHLLEQGRFVYLAQPLCSFRHHEGQQTKKNAVALNFVDDLKLLFDTYLARPYAGVPRLDQSYMLCYSFYKLLKHADQGLFERDLVLKKIDTLYGWRRFVVLSPLFRLYTPLWKLKRAVAVWMGRE